MERTRTGLTNGAAMAAYLAAGIGALVMGIVVFLNAVGLLPVPALYAPAGGVTGRTALAVVAWLVAWGVLHAKWKSREMPAGRVHLLTVVFVLLGALLCYPPLWEMV